MALIIPSILEETPEALKAKVESVLKIPNVQRIQIDFSDGKFTPHKTALPEDVDVLNPAYFWEGHLMAKEPRKYFLDAQIAGFNGLIIHFEALADASELKDVAAELKEYKFAAGLAINPETKIEEVLPYADLFEQILIMSVHPGYQGAEFLSESIDRVKKLRKAAKNVKIEVDGGIKLEQVKPLIAAGADYLVIGSALWQKAEESGIPASSAAVNFQKFEIETQTA